MEGPLINVPLRSYNYYEQNVCEQISKRYLSKSDEVANTVLTAHQLQFPELRLIEYDCGKILLN